jgi:hypothetical protein
MYSIICGAANVEVSRNFTLPNPATSLGEINKFAKSVLTIEKERNCHILLQISCDRELKNG